MMTLNRIAQVCHEANRAYCQTIGDNSQPDWNNAPEWQKQSAISGVHFHLNNPDAGPEGSHRNWMMEKAVAGWKFGAVKDPSKKEHPCMVAYDLLSPEQRAKDAVFVGIVHALKPLLQFRADSSQPT
jgi:hypothetical protein